MAGSSNSDKCQGACVGVCKHMHGAGRKYAIGRRRQRPVRLHAEGENRGRKLLLVVGVFSVLLYGLFRLLYGP